MNDDDKTQHDRGRAPRARNRTVMLTADLASQVRARLAQEEKEVDDSAVDQELNSSQEIVGPFKLSEPVEEQFENGSYDLNEPITELNATEDEYYSATEVHVEAELESIPVVETSIPNENVANNVEAPRQPETMSQKPVAAPVLDDVTELLKTVSSDSNLVGFLIEMSGTKVTGYVELKEGRLIVSSEEVPGTPTLVMKDRGVSRMHAIIRVGQTGELQVLDQLSEQGTVITRFGSGEVEQLSGDKGVLSHGDLITFGQCTFRVCLVPGM